MIRLMHISDLHVGDAPECVLAAAITAAHRLRPDCIVATGDLTEAGRRREYRRLAAFLAGLPAPVVACPGNHDVPVFDLPARLAAPFARFRRLGLAEGWASDCGSVQVQAFNTARAVQLRLDWSQGVYGRGFDRALARLGPPLATHGGRAGSASRWRILACHHPPCTPPGARVSSTPRRAGPVAARLAAEPNLLLLCGHVHGHWEMPLGSHGARLLTAPSLGSRRQRGGVPGFLEIGLGAPDLPPRVAGWHFDGSVFRPSRA